MARSRNSRRGAPKHGTRRWRRSYLPRDVKQLEHQRTRAREAQALRVAPESAPLRDAPWMRWDLWSWD